MNKSFKNISIFIFISDFKIFEKENFIKGKYFKSIKFYLYLHFALLSNLIVLRLIDLSSHT